MFRKDNNAYLVSYLENDLRQLRDQNKQLLDKLMAVTGNETSVQELDARKEDMETKEDQNLVPVEDAPAEDLLKPHGNPKD